MNLSDYTEVVATLASIFTMGHMLSGTLVCKDIFKKGSSEGFDAKPFVGGIGVGLLMFQYAFILNDPAMIRVNIFGMLTSLAYVSVFYIYSPKKMEMLKLILKTLGIAGIFLIYARLENPKYLEFRYGLITTVILLMLIATPLMNLSEVIKTKSTEILPFPLITMGVIVSSLWLLYGTIINNGFIIFQNIVGVTLYVIQLSLFVIYPSKTPMAEKDERKKE